MKRRLLALLLALCMIVGMSPVSVFAIEAVPDASAGTGPTEAVPEAAPTEAETEAAPTETVTEAAPTEAVTEAAPTEAVAEATPMEAIPEAAPMEAIPDPSSPAIPGDSFIVSTHIPKEAVTGEPIPVSFSVTNWWTADVSDTLYIDFSGTNIDWNLYMAFESSCPPDIIFSKTGPNDVSAYLVNLTVPAGQTVTVNATIYVSDPGTYSLSSDFNGSEPARNTLTVTGEAITPVVHPSTEGLPAKVSVGQPFDFTLSFKNTTCANINRKTMYMDFLGTNTGSALKVLDGRYGSMELQREEDAAGLHAYSMAINTVAFGRATVSALGIASAPGTYQFKLTDGKVESEVYTLVVEEAVDIQPFSIGAQGYPDLQTAIDAAKTGDTILMNQDTSSGRFYLNIENDGTPQALTLDLGGHVLTMNAPGNAAEFNGSEFIWAVGVNLTLANGTLKIGKAPDYGTVIRAHDTELSLKNFRIESTKISCVYIDGQSKLSVDADSVIYGFAPLDISTRNGKSVTAEIAGTVRATEFGVRIMQHSGDPACRVHFASTALMATKWESSTIVDGNTEYISTNQLLFDSGSRFSEDPLVYVNDTQATFRDTSGFYVVTNRTDSVFSRNLQITASVPRKCATGKMCTFDMTIRNVGDTVYQTPIVVKYDFPLAIPYFGIDTSIPKEEELAGYILSPHMAPGSTETLHFQISSDRSGPLTLVLRTGTEVPLCYRQDYEGEHFVPTYELTVDAPAKVTAGSVFRVNAALNNSSDVIGTGNLTLCMLNASADTPFEMDAENDYLNPHYNAENIQDGGSVSYYTNPSESMTACYLVTIPNPGEYQFQLSTGSQKLAPFTVTVSDALAPDPAYCEARIGNVGYNTLQNALDNAQPGDTIILLKDITSPVLSLTHSDLHLDLGGHTLTMTSAPYASNSLRITDGKLTLANGILKAGSTNFHGNVIEVTDGDLNLVNLRLDPNGNDCTGVRVTRQSNLSVDQDSVICGNEALDLNTFDNLVLTADIAGTVRSTGSQEAIYSYTNSGSTGCQIHFASTAVIDGRIRTHGHDQILMDNGSRFRNMLVQFLNDRQVAVKEADGYYVVKDRSDVTFTHDLEITATMPQKCATGEMCEFDVTFRNLSDTVYQEEIFLSTTFSASDMYDIYCDLDIPFQYDSSMDGYVLYPHIAPGSVTTMHCKTSSAYSGMLTFYFQAGTEEPLARRMAFEGEQFVPSYELTADAPTKVSTGMTFRIYATVKNPSAVVGDGWLTLRMLNASADKPFEMNAGSDYLNLHHNDNGVMDGGSVWYRLDPSDSSSICYVVKIPNKGNYQFQLSTYNQQMEPFTIEVTDPIPANPSTCEARIGTVGFRTLQEALDNARAGDTVCAMKDIVSPPISCQGVDLRLDLLGHKLTLRDMVNRDSTGFDIQDSRLDIYNGHILSECILSMNTIVLDNSVMNLYNTSVDSFGKEIGNIFYPSHAITVANGSRLHVDADSVLFADTGIMCNETYNGACEVIFEGQIRHGQFIDSVSCWNSALNITFTETAVVDGVLTLNPPATAVFRGGRFLEDPSAYLRDDQLAVRGADRYYTINALTPPSEGDPVVVQQTIPAAGVTGEALPVSFTVINNTDTDYYDFFTLGVRNMTNHHPGEALALVMDGDVVANPMYGPGGISGYESMIHVPAHGQVTLNGTLYVSTPGTYKFISTFQNAYPLPSQLEVTGETIQPDIQISATTPQAPVPVGTMGHMALVVKNSSAVSSYLDLDVTVQGPKDGKGLQLRYDRLNPNKQMEPGFPERCILYLHPAPYTTYTYNIDFLATEPGTYTVSYLQEETGKTITQTVEITPYVEPDRSQCVAKVGNLYFRTLDEGIAALNSGDTLTLLKDVTADSAVIFHFDRSYSWGSLVKNTVITVDLNGHTLRIRPHSDFIHGIESSNMDLTLRNGTVRWASAPLPENNMLVGFSRGHLTLENAVIGDREFSAASVGIEVGDGSVVNIDAASVVWGTPAVSTYSFYQDENTHSKPVELIINGRLECGAPDNQAYALKFDSHYTDSVLTIGSSAVLRGWISLQNTLRNFNVANGAGFTVRPINLLHVGQNLEKDTSGLWKVVAKKNETTVQPLPQEIPLQDQAAVQQAAQNVQAVIFTQEPTPEDVAAAEKQGATNVKVDTYLDVTVEKYENTPEAKTLVMNIEPMAQVKATKGNEEINIGSPKPIEDQPPVEVLIPLPEGFAAEGEIIYLIHSKDDGTVYEYELPVQKGKDGSLFIQFYNVNGFSTFAVTKIKPEPQLTITQQVVGNSSVTFRVANTGTAAYHGELAIYVRSDVTGGELTLTFPENVKAVKTSYGYLVPITVPAETGVVTLEAAAAANMSGVYRVASSVNGTSSLESVLRISSQKLIKLMGANVVAGNNLNMMFAIPGSGYNWEGCSATIVRTYSDGRSPAVEQYPFAEWEAVGNNYAVTYKGLAAKEMTDTLMVTVYNAQGEALTESWQDSMCSYAMRTLEKEGISPLQKTVMVDMLNYGAAAQKHFHYGTGTLANRLLNADQQSFASTQKPLVHKLDQGSMFVASNLVLKSNLQFLLAFKDLTEDMHAVVTFQNHYGKPIEKNIPGSQFGTADRYRTIIIDNLVMADARQEITVTIYRADGTIYTECHESIEDYLSRQSALSEVYQMVIRFADSACVYLNSKIQ